ncbi:MAG: indole-3-glycerol phosphate synthase TrpC [Proteobacteria bacterium]|nr:indole-3-glycerol phosphate synthase TrpC [Pseudomonadota bacterium]
MSVLDKIAESTRKRVAKAKERLPPAELRTLALAAPKPRDFAAPLIAGSWGVIAEVKFASPSEGEIAKGLDAVAVAKAYAASGASAISVLTEPEFFKGSVERLASIRAEVSVPLLMKDFILDEYQLLQARAAGADAALLIVAMIGEDGLKALLPKVTALGLTPLVEVHDEAELTCALTHGARLIGVNNRNLKTLKVDLETSRRLAALARKDGVALVSESGITTREQIEELASLGYKGFLIGTHFIKSGRPGEALRELLNFAGEGDEL